MNFNIRVLRAIKNISQTELAIQAGISLSAVRAVESGENYTISSLERVLYVLGYELCIKEKGGQDERN